MRWEFGVTGVGSIINRQAVILNKVIRGRSYWEGDIWSKTRRRWGLEQRWLLTAGGTSKRDLLLENDVSKQCLSRSYI